MWILASTVAFVIATTSGPLPTQYVAGFKSRREIGLLAIRARWARKNGHNSTR